MVSGTLTNPASADPDVVTTNPVPVSGPPHVSGTRSGHDLYLQWRWRNIDVDDNRAEAGGRSRHSGRGYQKQAQ